MTRFVLLAFLCLGASISRAEGMLPGGATLDFNKVLLHEGNSEGLAEPAVDPDSLYRYFNQAHCLCSVAAYNTPLPGFFEDKVGFEIVVTNYTMAIDRPVEVWTGVGCDTTDTTQRMTECHRLPDAPNVSVIAAAGAAIIEIPLYDVMVPKTAERPGCGEGYERDGTTWLLVDADGDGATEYSNSKIVKIDTKPPPLPETFRAVGAENAIEISWDPPAAGVTDIAYYQALCEVSNAGGQPGTTSPKPPRYQTANQLCGGSGVTLLAKEITANTAVDGGVSTIELSSQIAALDAAFVCGETMSGTATSLRLEGLTNFTNYTVVFLAIDLYGNASGAYFTSSLQPQPATDFWEDLHDQGSDVEGGFCLIAQTFGDDDPLTRTLRAFRDNTLAESAFGRWLIDVYYATVGGIDLHGSVALRVVAAVVLLPVVTLALLWHMLTLPGLLALFALALIIRKRPRWFARFAVAGVLLLPLAARAQTPYWEDPITSTTNEGGDLPIGDPERVRWHAGIRLGPYVPEIDDQLNMPQGDFAGPYEQMFGGWTILPMLDVDFIILRQFGQLGVGVSLGYMGKKEKAWLANSDPNDPNRPRAEGDSNAFRLIPLPLNAVYRLSWFDDEFGVPLVPYAKAGLAYYIWWVTAPNGDFAKACIGGGSTPDCPMTTAAGATMGFVGTIGLAIRAERIDEAAARSMRESGIEHAGFYGELSMGKVDGFGSDKKLSVGDTTWFAGVDFEF